MTILPRRERLLGLLLVLALIGPSPAIAGLIYDWVSVSVYDENGDEIDPVRVKGKTELVDGIPLGGLVDEGDDFLSFEFTDPASNSWDLEQLLKAQAIADANGLGLGQSDPRKKGRQRRRRRRPRRR